MSPDDSFTDLPLTALTRGHDGSSHLVQFYEDDAYLVDSVSRVIGKSLEDGDGAVIIATQPHREAIEERLEKRGLDLPALSQEGHFLSLDARETLAKISLDEYPNAACGAAARGVVERPRQAQLARLVDDLLDVARITRGRISGSASD